MSGGKLQNYSESFSNNEGEISVRMRPALGGDRAPVYTFEGEGFCYR